MFHLGVHPKGTEFTEFKEKMQIALPKIGDIKGKIDERQGKTSERVQKRIFIHKF